MSVRCWVTYNAINNVFCNADQFASPEMFLFAIVQCIKLFSSTDCSRVFASNIGTFSSPQYPSAYPNNAACTYNITVDANKRISILFAVFALENHSSCKYDKLEIYEGSVKSATYCGSSHQGKTYESQGNKLFLRFSSDSSVTKQGFLATYSAATGK